MEKFFFVPGGFKVSEETENEINKGIVIQDIEGNEFVWVPVQNIGEMIINSNEDIILDNVSKSTRTYSNLRIRELDKTKFSMVKTGDITSSREPDILRDYDTKEEYYKGILGFNTVDDMADSMIKEYNNMLNSINKYNGFYVGRYELTGSISEPTVKKGKVLTTQEAGNWYYLYRSCNNMINTMYAKTTMIYGCQWDEICEWLKECGFDTDNDSSKWGNYSNTGGTDEPTGSNEKWQANKIYDLAGNHWEFTQEAYSTNYRVGRAGAFGSTSPAADRNIDTPISLDTADTTRVTLYIK